MGVQQVRRRRCPKAAQLDRGGAARPPHARPAAPPVAPCPPVQHSVLVQVRHRLCRLHKDGGRLLLAVLQPQLMQVVNHLPSPAGGWGREEDRRSVALQTDEAKPSLCILQRPPAAIAADSAAHLPEPLEHQHQLARRANHILAVDDVWVVEHAQQVGLPAAGGGGRVDCGNHSALDCAQVKRRDCERSASHLTC